MVVTPVNPKKVWSIALVLSRAVSKGHEGLEIFLGYYIKVTPGYTVLVQLCNKDRTKEKQNQKNFLAVQFPLANIIIAYIPSKLKSYM